MDTPRKSPRRVLRVAVAAFALTTAVAATAGTSAHAYPPSPPPPGDTGSDVEVEPPVPPPNETGSDVVESAPIAPAQGDLPATGSSGVPTTLIAGGLALLLGVGLTSQSVVSGRRRSSADDSVG